MIGAIFQLFGEVVGFISSIVKEISFRDIKEEIIARRKK